ncbi:hypothetical protein DSUL_140061 [Desulfovibrionales bacterium]
MPTKIPLPPNIRYISSLYKPSNALATHPQISLKLMISIAKGEEHKALVCSRITQRVAYVLDKIKLNKIQTIKSRVRPPPPAITLIARLSRHNHHRRLITILLRIARNRPRSILKKHKSSFVLNKTESRLFFHNIGQSLERGVITIRKNKNLLGSLPTHHSIGLTQ